MTHKWPLLPADDSPEATKEAGLSDGDQGDVYDQDAADQVEYEDDE